MRVFLILSGPGLPRNEASDQLCYLVDLFPDLRDLTGTPIPPSVEGKSLLPIIHDTARHTRLFDLQSDPGEQTNLADHPAHAKTLPRIRVLLLLRLRDEHGDTVERGSLLWKNHATASAGVSLSAPGSALVRTEPWNEKGLDTYRMIETRHVTAEVWTAAFQADLDADGKLHIPTRGLPYYIDGPLVLKSGPKHTTDPRTEICLKPGSNTCMVRNRHVTGFADQPVPAETQPDTDITLWRIADIRVFQLYDQPNLEGGRDKDLGHGVGTLRNTRFESLTFHRPGKTEVHANTDGLVIEDVALHHPLPPDWHLLALGPKSMTYKGGEPEDPQSVSRYSPLTSTARCATSASPASTPGTRRQTCPSGKSSNSSSRKSTPTNPRPRAKAARGNASGFTKV